MQIHNGNINNTIAKRKKEKKKQIDSIHKWISKINISYGPNFFLLKNLEINLMSDKLLKFFKDDLINL